MNAFPKAVLLSEMRHYLEAIGADFSSELNDLSYEPLSGGNLRDDHPLIAVYAKKHLRDQGHRLFEGERQLSSLFGPECSSCLPKKVVEAYTGQQLALEYDRTAQLNAEVAEKVYAIYESVALMDSDDLFSQFPVSEIYRFLYLTTAFERFLHTKFIGQKRFSIEGSESVLLALELLKRLFFKEGTSIAVGMSHRGRISAMASVFMKPIHEIFLEFMNGDHCLPKNSPAPVMGDVKYHKGASYQDPYNGLQAILLPNSSHLESVYPITLGYTRGRQDRHGKNAWASILLHGDASLSGQGVVYESLQMSKLKAYDIGGAIHIVIDNRVGFTASPEESRSTPRPTDIFRPFAVPILHVSNDSPLHVIRAALIASQIRQELNIDVAIRVVGFRKWGHNESDDPTFTQPRLYKNIADHPPAYEILQGECSGILSDVVCSDIQTKIRTHLQKEYTFAKECIHKHSEGQRTPARPKKEESETEGNMTAQKSMDFESFLALLHAPEEFRLHDRARQFLEKRRESLQTDREQTALDWSFAEFLAFALLLNSGHSVRLTGQDVRRGTFTHRHAVFIDQDHEGEWSPLQDLGHFCAYNTHLSEYACLAFEYGYSLVCPKKNVVVWEAQFGDFVNGAQIIIDQYLSAARDKWLSQSNLVLLLPHGYEGQGPEHSSCRLERFLSLCALDNMIVASPSTPATYVHLLLQKAISHRSCPLVVLTPKAMLRDDRCTSTFEECIQGELSPVRILHEPSDRSRIEYVFMSTGKYALELADMVCKRNLQEKSLVLSLEILYPFPAQELFHIVQSVSSDSSYIWAQEEPVNMGACAYIEKEIKRHRPISKELFVFGRPESTSPATGMKDHHDNEALDLEERIFSIVE